MSYRVLVIPEDFRKDQYVLEPILTKMFEFIGRKAKVMVCTDPVLRGVAQALEWKRLQEIIVDYRAMVDCFLLVVDRDGNKTRRKALDGLEKQAAEELGPGKFFLAENAWQEVEVWLLAGHDLPAEWSWKDVRAHENPKETYYLPFAKSRGVANNPAEGRGLLAREAASKYRRIRTLCPELKDLERRLSAPP